MSVFARDDRMSNVIVYSKKDCPNCDLLKKLLNKENIPYKVVNIFTPEAMTELSMNSVFARSAPILQIGPTVKCCHSKFYTTREMCPNLIDIDTDIVKNIIKDNGVTC